jgi:osmotically-inducible protein OsmY
MSFTRPLWSCSIPLFGSASAQATECREAALAQALLRQSPYPPLHGVACRFRDGVLTLTGRVPSYYLKQIAQSLVLSVEGVMQVHNDIEATEWPGRR